MQALRAEDNIVATYREHGHALLRGTPPGSVMAEMFGKMTGCSRGRGGSMHLFDAERRLYGGHAIVAGGLPVAVGLALADRMQKRKAVTACFFGDGATDEGEYHESLNLAALWRLPVLFVCENNRYAMGTALERHEAVTDLCVKPRAYGIDVANASTAWTCSQCEEGARKAVLHVMETRAAVLRGGAHVPFPCALHVRRGALPQQRGGRAVVDDARSDRQLLAPAPRTRLARRRDARSDEAEIGGTIAAAVEEAEAAPLEPVEDLETDVYTPGVAP